jgi:hypothetical protein
MQPGINARRGVAFGEKRVREKRVEITSKKKSRPEAGTGGGV